MKLNSSVNYYNDSYSTFLELHTGSSLPVTAVKVLKGMHRVRLEVSRGQIARRPLNKTKKAEDCGTSPRVQS